jgi:23S rRNA pseudouridine1911/1915/1917 synthase
MILSYNVEKENLTINQILKNELNISSRLFGKLIRNKLVSVNGKVCDTRNLVKKGDIIEIALDYPEDNSNILPKKMDLHIIYEDDCFIILDKPAGIAVHPSMLHFDDTLSNGLKYYFDSINLKKKIRPINRLDLNTSGLIIFAKNEYIQECLIQQMEANIFQKEYLAIIEGILPEKFGTINKPIGRKDSSVIERCISEKGKPSITHYEVLKEFNNLSLVKCKLETGRTHQIRVHFASIGHPLLGDTLYGHSSDLIDGQALLCYKLTFIHPISKQHLCFSIKNFGFKN